MGYEEQYNKLRGACGLDVKFITWLTGSIWCGEREVKALQWREPEV